MSKQLEKMEEQLRFERFKRGAKIGACIGFGLIIAALRHWNWL